MQELKTSFSVCPSLVSILRCADKPQTPRLATWQPPLPKGKVPESPQCPPFPRSPQHRCFRVIETLTSQGIQKMKFLQFVRVMLPKYSGCPNVSSTVAQRQ